MSPLQETSRGMSRAHRIVFWFIALLAVGTFVFGVLQLVGSRPTPTTAVPLSAGPK